MGSDSSRIKNCCSCLDQTQIGENTSSVNNASTIYQRKQNMISLQQGNLSLIIEEKKPISNHSLILVGEKQCGKTTLINILENKQNQQPQPTQYPNMSLVKTCFDKQRRSFMISETDFQFINSSQWKSLAIKNSGFVLVIKYDNIENVHEQIRKFSRLDRKQKPCAVVINNFSAESPEIVKKNVKTLLSNYPINACAVEILDQDEQYGGLLVDMIKQEESVRTSEAR